MTMKRDDLDNQRVDFSEVTTGKRLEPTHPGDILREDFLKPFALSVYQLAHEIHVPRSRVNDIVRGKRSITTDTALRLSRFFGTSAEFWMNLQTRHDLDVTERTSRKKIAQEITPHAA